MLIFREELTAADIANLTRIVAETGFFTEPEISVARELMEDRLSKRTNSDYLFLVAEQSGTTLGYSCYGHITVTQSAYDLYWLVVSRAYQGQGIGKKLLQETERRITAHGGTALYAETSSQPLYEPTRRFYSACGFQPEAVLRDFYKPGDHRITFSKPVV